MNKLEELILKEYDLKVGDKIIYTEYQNYNDGTDKVFKSHIEIVDKGGRIFCETQGSSYSIINLFNTNNKFEIEKMKPVSKSLTCNTCRSCEGECALYGICCLNPKENIYEYMKRVIERFYNTHFVDEIKEDIENE